METNKPAMPITIKALEEALLFLEDPSRGDRGTEISTQMLGYIALATEKGIEVEEVLRERLGLECSLPVAQSLYKPILSEWKWVAKMVADFREDMAPAVATRLQMSVECGVECGYIVEVVSDEDTIVCEYSTAIQSQLVAERVRELIEMSLRFHNITVGWVDGCLGCGHEWVSLRNDSCPECDRPNTED